MYLTTHNNSFIGTHPTKLRWVQDILPSYDELFQYIAIYEIHQSVVMGFNHWWIEKQANSFHTHIIHPLLYTHISFTIHIYTLYHAYIYPLPYTHTPLTIHTTPFTIHTYTLYHTLFTIHTYTLYHTHKECSMQHCSEWSLVQPVHLNDLESCRPSTRTYDYILGIRSSRVASVGVRILPISKGGAQRLEAPP